MLGLVYDPNKSLSWNKPSKKQGKPVSIADDLQLGAMGLEKVSIEDDGAVMTWGKTTDTKDYNEAEKPRTAQITDTEIQDLKEKNLDIIKAQEIKRYWAIPDMSYHKASKLINKRGFSPTVLRDYWAIFNKWA